MKNRRSYYLKSYLQIENYKLNNTITGKKKTNQNHLVTLQQKGFEVLRIMYDGVTEFKLVNEFLCNTQRTYCIFIWTIYRYTFTASINSNPLFRIFEGKKRTTTFFFVFDKNIFIDSNGNIRGIRIKKHVISGHYYVKFNLPLLCNIHNFQQ